MDGRAAARSVEVITPTPGAAFRPLEFKISGGHVTFTVPQVAIYTIIRIR